MSGIHKSREVYKFTDTRTGKKLVPVRGLYVSGLHTEPRYMDHWISVNNFSSSDATIVDYTENDIDQSFVSLTTSQIETNALGVVNYTHHDENQYDYSLTGLDITTNDLQVVSYNSQTVQQQLSSLCSLDVESNALNIRDYTSLSVDSSLEHVLTVNTYTSNTCTIT